MTTHFRLGALAAAISFLLCLSTLEFTEALSPSLIEPASMVATPPNILGRDIFLFSFPTVPHVYSMSPFSIKLESFLRMHKINYELKEGLKFSSQGTIPFIKLDSANDDGFEISDSNVIIRQLQRELGEEHCDAVLTPEQRAVSHMVIRMLEEHTAQILFHYRYGLHMDAFVDALELRERFPPGFADKWKAMQPKMTQEKSKRRGLLRHDKDQLWSFSNDDIQSISDYLGDKRFFHGDKPTLVDCAIFGHLSQCFIPIDFPQKRYIHDHCPNLVGLLKRFRLEFWPELSDEEP